MSEPFIGEIRVFGFNFAPRGWAFCQGQIMSIAQNTALFSLLGTTYGGDGQTTFALPDLRSRSVVGMGQGPGLSNIVQGEISGTENATLLLNNLPAHIHPATAVSTLFAEGIAGTSQNPQGKMIGGHANAFVDPNPADNKALNSEAVTTAVTVGQAGNSQPFPIRNPYLGMNVCIALTGIFPSRN